MTPAEFVELVAKAEEATRQKIDVNIRKDGLANLTVGNTGSTHHMASAIEELERLANPHRPETIWIEVPYEWALVRMGGGTTPELWAKLEKAVNHEIDFRLLRIKNRDKESDAIREHHERFHQLGKRVDKGQEELGVLEEELDELERADCNVAPDELSDEEMKRMDELPGLIEKKKQEIDEDIRRTGAERSEAGLKSESVRESKSVSGNQKTKSGCPECRSTDVVFESHDQDYSTLDSDMRLPRPMGFRCLACGCEFELSRTPGTVPKIIEHGAAYQEAKTPIPEIEESKPGIQISKSGFRCSECASSRMTNPTGREWYSTDGGRIVELQCTGCMGKFVVECVG